MLKTLTCRDCQSAFTYEQTRGRNRERCDPCRKARKNAYEAEKQRRWREANPERHREHMITHREKRKLRPDITDYRWAINLRAKYGITVADYEAMIEAQDGLCAICRGKHRGSGGRLHVDHCHDSGKVRGLLCGPCNTAIGLLDHDEGRVRQVIEYLSEEKT